MNPLRWKPEHRAALLVAILVGAAVGLGIGYVAENPDWRFRTSLVAWVGRKPDDAIVWTCMGAAVAGGLLYVWRLLSRSN